jgi:hypothetical protein
MACNSPSTEHVVKARVLMLRRADPNLSYSILAHRTGAAERTIRRWLKEAGLGQGLRTEDARGQTPPRNEALRQRPAVQITDEHLESLDDFQMRDDGASARPRNAVVAELCPESL